MMHAAAGDFPARIAARAALVEAPVTAEIATALSAYLELLGRWNRKINLTSLDVDPPSDDAIDRLIVEPIVAARHVRPTDQFAIDVGSGGGSPAVPLKLARPTLRFVLVEVKLRKAAFLREVVRHLQLSDVAIENRRCEDLTSRADLHACADLITLRAVKIDAALMETMRWLLKPGGRVWCFGSGRDSVPDELPGFSVETYPLVPAMNSRLIIGQIT